MTLMQHLLTLHRVDSQVRALQGRVAAADRDVTAQATLLAGLDRQTKELESQSRQLQATIKNLEVEALGFTERTTKLRGELNSAQNDKQYKAILHELKTLEGKKDECEGKALTEMERLKEVETQQAKLAAQVAERRKVHDHVKAQADERRAECSGRLSELERERDIATKAVPEKERAIFKRVAEVTEGEAMAEIDEIDRRHKEYACGECRIEIPYASVATLMSNPNALVQCTSCSRILYLAEATKEVLRK
ncbi:MAG: hypothetical protein JNM94_12545 [Phycisphaerae bacterium]|nr:hypothetical protein [Phycisphaerae bacterium]